MDLEVQKLFVRSALNLAISGTLILNNEQLTNLYEECSVMAASLDDISTLVIAHDKTAKVSYELSRFDKALRSNNILLLIFHYNGHKKWEAVTCANLGNCYHSLGQYDKTIKHYEISLKIAKEIGNKEVEENAHSNLGSCYYSLEKYNKAITHYKMSLKIARETRNKEVEGSAYRKLGNCCYSLGQYDKAVTHHEKSLKIATEIGDKKGEGGAYNNLGNCYHSLGQYDKAITHYETCLKIARQIGDVVLKGAQYGGLGNCYYSLGQYDNAVSLHVMSLKVATVTGNKAADGIANGNLGSCYYSLGQYDKAVKHQEMTLRIALEIGDKELERSAHGNLGNCYRSLGQHDKAITHHEISLNIATEIRDKKVEGSTYCNLGDCYHDIGEYHKAVKLYERSLKIAREIGHKEVEGHANGNLGNCYHSLGQYDKAVKHYETSLKIATEIGDKPGEGPQHCNLGILYYRLEQSDKAVCKLKEGLKRFEDLFQTTPQMDELKVSFRENFSRFYSLLVDVLIEQNQTNKALIFCERGRARALVDLMHFKYFLRAYENEEDLLDLAAVHRLVTLLRSTVLYLTLTKDCLYIWIIQLNGGIRFKKTSLPVQKKDRHPNEVVVPLSEQVNAMIYKFRSYCFPTKCEDRSLSLLYSETEMKQNDERRRPKLNSLNALLKAEVDEKLFPKKWTTESSDKDTLVRNPFPDEEDADNSALQKLHQLLLAPVHDLIEGKEVVIVPQGSLHLVPFAALIDEHGHYVAESLRVRIFPSLTTAKMILENGLKPNEEIKPLIVGDPDTGRFPRLPCAKEEARMVAKLFNTKPVIGGEATKEKVLLSMENASLIHIAAHGNMERGEILLARSPTGTDISTEPKTEDNMLLMTHLEHKLIKAKLVVLSCCYSARGKVTADGVVGIARAFLGAGARSVLVALWAIDDGATLYFMQRFYKHLTQGESAGESLNKAMAAMRASGKYSDPRHWAPFVLIGDDVIVC